MKEPRAVLPTTNHATNYPATIEDWGLSPAVEHIAAVQRPDGLVPWYRGGPADPWDHVESAMGLSVGGRERAAAEAYRWLARNQLPDGSWWATYGADGDDDGGARAGGADDGADGVGIADGGEDADDEGPHRETHRTAYVAVGVWHHYLIADDRAFLAELWPTVEGALDFAVDLQRPTGEVAWAVDADGEPDEDALLSGCASIHLSLDCGLAIARELGRDRPAWRDARARLAAAVRERDDRFDRTWESKAGYAMNWYYPVLGGVLTGERARARLAERWDRFVEPRLGCRCVADEPWVTVAESAELAMALAATGRSRRAVTLFEWLSQWTDEDGVFWMGYQFEDDEIWPAQRPTWTAGAAVLAADALGGLTPAAGLFADHG